MQYMRWGSLQEVFDAGYVFGEDEIIIVAYSLLKALVFLQGRGYVHGDIKVGYSHTVIETHRLNS